MGCLFAGLKFHKEVIPLSFNAVTDWRFVFITEGRRQRKMKGRERET